MKFIKINLLLLALAFALSSCGAVGQAPTENEQVTNIEDSIEESQSSTIERVTSLDMAIRPFDTLNPLMVKDKNVANVLNLMYEKLFTYDEKLKPVPELCSDYFFDTEKNAYIIGLKKDLVFSNGEPLTVDSVIYSLNVLMAQSDDVYYKGAIKNVRNYYVDSEGKIVIELFEGVPMVATSLVFPIISEEEYVGTFHSVPLGSGVYKMNGQSAYYKFSLSENSYSKKIPKISEINIEAVDDERKEVTAFENDIFDIAFSDISNWLSYKKSHDSFASKVDSNELEFIGFNYNNMFLADVKVREALKYSVPYNKILEDIYLGFGAISNTGVNPKSWLYNEVSKGANFDLEYATSILKGAGYKYNEAGNVFTSVDETQTPLSFNLLVNKENKQRVEIAEIYKEELESIGIKINIVALDYLAYIEALNNKDYDIFIGGFTQDATQNYGGMFLAGQPFEIQDESFVNLYNNLLATKTQSAYVTAHHGIQNYVLNNVAIIPIAFREDAMLTKGNIENASSTFDNYFYNIEEWVYNIEVVE